MRISSDQTVHHFLETGVSAILELTVAHNPKVSSKTAKDVPDLSYSFTGGVCPFTETPTRS